MCTVLWFIKVICVGQLRKVTLEIKITFSPHQGWDPSYAACIILQKYLHALEMKEMITHSHVCAGLLVVGQENDRLNSRHYKLKGDGAHKEGRISLRCRSLHYSQACVPATGFIYGPNKEERNILWSRLQSGLLWLEKKLSRGGGVAQSRSTFPSLFLQRVSSLLYLLPVQDCSSIRCCKNHFTLSGRIVW